MKNHSSKNWRPIFEVDNARNLSMQQLVETFIPTQSFWRLLSAKHHVLLGARGQGKTAVAKMLSHDHLELMARTRGEPRARSAVLNQDFIGIYLPTRLEWVGGLENKSWLKGREREELFQWRLNIASCVAFIPIVKSCISTYVKGIAKQAKVEKELAHQLSKDWIAETGLRFDDLLQLRRHLEDTDYRKQIQLLRKWVVGYLPEGEMPEGLAFGIELLAPLRQGIRQLSRILSINPKCTWLLCIDEAEFLDKADHQIINSHMRAYPDNLFIKMTTMPYHHHTLATNIGADLVNGHDFEYVSMDSDSVMNARVSGDSDTIGTLFGRTLFRKLIQLSTSPTRNSSERNINGAEILLGGTTVLDPCHERWSLNSKNMKLLEKYGSAKTINRAYRLIGTPRFQEAIGRKINGALLLRKEVDEWTGNKALTSYSGARMAIRCADGNPRRLIRIFNALLSLCSREQNKGIALRLKVPKIQPKDQTRALRDLSSTAIKQIKSFPYVGPELHEFILMLGEYMHANLHKKPLTTDQTTSIQIDSKVSKADWELVKKAVSCGYLYPNANSINSDEMPFMEGTFHLAYFLAPYFLLLPRRGSATSLSVIKKYHKMTQKERTVYLNCGQIQPFLFNEGDIL